MTPLAMRLPTVPDTFAWVRHPWGDALVCRPLAEVAPHLFTTRQLELRLGGDRAEGWRAVTSGIGVDAAHLVRVTQVHGRDVFVVRDNPRLTSEATGVAADSIVSNSPSAGVAVQVADCVPVLMADPRTGAVAAVHAGWRGMAAGAVPAAIGAMRREFGTRAADLVAAVGPSIGPCCYEVGMELVDAFRAAGHGQERIDRWFIDPGGVRTARADDRRRLNLWTAASDQLVDSGLDARHVYLCGLCTASHIDVFYSYRVEGAATGRLAAAIRAGRIP